MQATNLPTPSPGLFWGFVVNPHLAVPPQPVGSWREGQIAPWHRENHGSKKFSYCSYSRPGQLLLLDPPQSKHNQAHQEPGIFIFICKSLIEVNQALLQ